MPRIKTAEKPITKGKESTKRSSKAKRRVKRVCIILVVTVLSYIIVSMAGSVVVFNIIFARTNTVNAFELTYADIDQSKYPRREISFSSGQNRLRGEVYPKQNAKGLIIVANGMNCRLDRHLPEIMWFLDHGFCVLTFENTGVGDSEGSGSVGIAQARLDLDAAIGYAGRDEELSKLPLLLYGHSLGGYAVATALGDSDEIRAAVCVSGFDSPNQNMHHSAKQYVGILADIQYPFMCLQNFFLFGDKSDASAVGAINSTDTPVLITGGSSDDVVTDEISILGRAGEITNPNAEIVEITEEYRGEHSTVWLSRESAKYLAETDHPTDKARANVLDEDFMQMILKFYEKAIG